MENFVLKINVLDNFVALLHKIIKDCWNYLLIFENISISILNEDKLTVKTSEGSDYNYLPLLQIPLPHLTINASYNNDNKHSNIKRC